MIVVTSTLITASLTLLLMAHGTGLGGASTAAAGSGPAVAVDVGRRGRDPGHTDVPWPPANDPWTVPGGVGFSRPGCWHPWTSPCSQWRRAAVAADGTPCGDRGGGATSLLHSVAVAFGRQRRIVSGRNL